MKISKWLSVMGSLTLVLCAILASGSRFPYIRSETVPVQSSGIGQYLRWRGNYISSHRNPLTRHKPRVYRPKTLQELDTNSASACSRFVCSSRRRCCDGLVCVGLGGSSQKACISLYG